MNKTSEYMRDTPYKGLMPYLEIDRLFFFGREDWQTAITERLTGSPLTVLYGASGVGKSSILRAGVAYHLYKAAQENWEENGKPELGVIVFPPVEEELKKKCSWQNPLSGIKKQLQVELEKLGINKEDLPQENLSFVETLKEWTNKISSESSKGRLYIILDQFEEYFVHLSQQSSKETDSFAIEFPKAIKAASLKYINVNFLISIRDDSLAKLDYFRSQISDLLDNRLPEIKHLNQNSAHEAIVKPIIEYKRQQDILDHLLNSRLTVLYGSREAHKSTVLRNGIAYYLNKVAHKNVEVHRTPGLAVVVFNDWYKNDNPLISLKEQIEADLKKLGVFRSLPPDLPFVEILKKWTELIGLNGKDGKLFIILDQFEEYFWYQPEQEQLKQELQQEFVQFLLSAIDDNNLKNANFLISIDETDRNNLVKIERLLDNISDKNYLYLLPIDKIYEDYKITHKEWLRLKKESDDKKEKDNISPLTQKKLDNEKKISRLFGIEPKLVEKLLDQIKRDRLHQKDQISTPYLQIVMTRLWKEEVRKLKDEEKKERYLRFDNAPVNFWLLLLEKNFLASILLLIQSQSSLVLSDSTYTRLKEAEGIVKEYVDKRLEPNSQEQEDPLTLEEAKIAACIFDYLVSPSGAKVSHGVKDLFEYAKRSVLWLQEQQVVESLLHKLSKPYYRILNPIGDERYEIYHDVLAIPINKWRTKFQQKQAEEDKKRRQQDAMKIAFSPKDKRSIIERLVLILMLPEFSSQKEKAAILARQAYLFNQQFNEDLLSEVDKALYQAVNIPYFSCMLHGHKKDVSSVAFSPDSKTFASGSYDGNVQLWDLDNKKKATTLSFGLKTREYDRYGGGVLSIAFSPNGKKLAVGCGNGKVLVRDLNSPDTEPITLMGHRDEVWSVAFHPEGKLLASGGWDNKVYLWDLENSKNISICGRIHPDWIWSVAFSPDGNTLAVGCRNGTVWLWGLRPSKKLKLIKVLVIDKENSLRHKFDKNDCNDRERQIFSITLSPDGKLLVAGSQDGKARFWDLSELDKSSSDVLPIREIEGQNMERLIVAFSHDGQRLASGSTTGKLQLWKREKDHYKFVEDTLLQGHETHDKKSGGVSSVAFSRDNQWLVSGSWDGTIKLCDLRPPAAAPIVLQGHKHRVATLAFSPNGKILASGSFDDTTRLWEWNNPESQFILLRDCDEGNVNSVAFSLSSDEQILASGNQSGNVRLWDIDKPNQVLQTLSHHREEVSSVAFNPRDSQILASGTHNCTIWLWNVKNQNKPIKILKGHKDRINSVAFSPDGNILASGDSNHIVRLWWDLELPDAPSILLPRFEGRISSIVFSPKPFNELQILAVATNRETIDLWDVSPLQKSLDAEPVFLSEYCSLKELKGICIAFSHDGQFLAAGSYDSKVRLWDLQQPKANPIVLEGCTKPIITLAFSPDGEWLAAGSQDNTIRIWIAKTKKLADMVCQKVWRNLTFQEWNEFVGEKIPYECTCDNLPPGEGVPASGQIDTSRNGFNLQLREDRLMPKQKKLLEIIKNATTQKPYLSEEDIAKALNKTKLDEVESIRLEALCRAGFITKTDNQQGKTRYRLSPAYRK